MFGEYGGWGIVTVFFWPKIHEQAMKCEQVNYRGAKAMNYFSTNFMAWANRYANIINDFSDCD